MISGETYIGGKERFNVNAGEGNAFQFTSHTQRQDPLLPQGYPGFTLPPARIVLAGQAPRFRTG